MTGSEYIVSSVPPDEEEGEEADQRKESRRDRVLDRLSLVAEYVRVCVLTVAGIWNTLVKAES